MILFRRKWPRRIGLGLRVSVRIVGWHDLLVPTMVAWWDPVTDAPIKRELDDVSSAAELVTKALRLESGRGHPAIEFIREDGSALSIATDGLRAFLVWTNSLGESFQSVGLDEDGPNLVVDYFGSWSEALPSDLVPLADGLDSVQAFLHTGAPDTPTVLFSPS